ncbi:serine protease [Bacteroidota bacterium]
MKVTKYVFSVLLFFSFISCSSDVYKTIYPTLVDGEYDSEFPYKSSSDQLEEIGESVKLLNTLAFYRSHIFDSGTNLKADDLTQDIVDEEASKITFFNHTASGTATVIYARDKLIALLTCAHIIDYPDTVISYFKAENGANTDYVQSFSIKERQSIYVTDLPEFGEVEVLLLDKDLDIAVLGKKLSNPRAALVPVFKYPVGRAKDLEWGSFVYIFGYPMNYKMVTKGIVSSPNKDGKGSFLIDAVFNRGFSGGIVLAIRDGVPNFEIVGLIRSVPAENEYLLKPVPTDEKIEYNPLLPYTGDIYVDQRISMKYGITRVIGIEEIVDYIKENENFLRTQGYMLDRFTDSD